jgi:hypothetical protein
MKQISTAICLAMFCAVSAMAQTSRTETKTTTKTSIKDGKEVTLTGCVSSAGERYMLTNVADKKGALHSYVLVSDDANLASHVGQLVQIRGRVTDRGDAKVQIEEKTETKVEHGDDKTTHRKAEVEGDDLPGPALLGVSSIKMIAGACR